MEHIRTQQVSACSQKDPSQFLASVFENGHAAVHRLAEETHTSERDVMDALERAAEKPKPPPKGRKGRKKKVGSIQI